jgi:hypothetical protein
MGCRELLFVSCLRLASVSLTRCHMSTLTGNGPGWPGSQEMSVVRPIGPLGTSGATHSSALAITDEYSSSRGDVGDSPLDYQV